MLDWSDVGENDILSTKIINKNNMTVYISTVSRNSIEGAINEITQDNQFLINGNYYRVDNQNVFDYDFELGMEGVFYLDIFGNIAYYEPTFQPAVSYAYVIDTGIYDVGFEDKLQIKAFTDGGEVIAFTCATKVALVRERANQSGTETVYYSASSSNFDELQDLLPPGCVITFGVNDQGEINKIALPGTKKGVNYFAKYAQGNDFDYRGKSGIIMVGSKYVEISEDTIIMIAGPGFNDDDYYLLSPGVLGERDILEIDTTTQVFDVNKNMTAGLIVIGKPINVTGEFAGLAMVSKISQIRDEDGDIINSLTLYQGGEVKEVEAEVENQKERGAGRARGRSERQPGGGAHHSQEMQAAVKEKENGGSRPKRKDEGRD